MTESDRGMSPETETSKANWTARRVGSFFEHVGILWTLREGDSWAYALKTETQHANHAGLIHGGAILTLIDHAFSLVAWEACGRNPCVTVQLDTHFLRAVQPGAFVECRPQISRRTRKLIFLDGKVSVLGREIASAKGIWAIHEAALPSKTA
jgi:uncharacterized protein (TIGR00369 family)